MNPTSLTLSPYVQNIVDQTGLEVVSIVRYGPRYACLQVVKADEQGFLKIALPTYEQELFREPHYHWTEHDLPTHLDARLVKEAMVLDHLSAPPNGPHTAMKMLGLNTDPPVWSMRTFLTHSSMSLNGSDFAFSPHFYEQVSASRLFGYFKAIHDLAPATPKPLYQYFVYYGVHDYVEMLFSRIAHQAQEMPAYLEQLDVIKRRFTLMANQPGPRPVMAHGEAYPPHFYDVEGELLLIDWENATWNNRHADLAAVYIRAFPHPDWQAALVDTMTQAGYMDEQGIAEWHVELLAQCFANHEYFRNYGPIVDASYQALGLAYFEKTINDILRTDAITNA
jgi:hypothetical protein